MASGSISGRSLRMPKRPDRLRACVESLCSVCGYDCYCRGNLEEAIELIRDHLRVSPDDGAAWELLGLALRDLGQPEQAAGAFERASLLHCIQPLSRICLAECYAVLKRPQLACDLYMMQVEELCDDVEMLLLVASGLDGIDRPHLALDVCRRAAHVDPQSGQVPYDMCFYSVRCGCRASVAKSLAWRAVELEPSNVHFRIGLASLLIKLEERERAAWVVSRLEQEQIEQVSCRCCLARVADLCKQLGELQAYQACLAQLKSIDLADATRD